MTRRSCTFAAALITIVTSLVAFTWAQAPAGGFEQFWGPNYTYPRLAAIAARRPNPPPDPGTSTRCTTGTRSPSIPPDSITRRCAAATRGSSASSSGPAARAAPWPSCTSPSSMRSTPSRGGTEATPDSRRAAGRLDGRGDRTGRARHARRDVSVAEGALRRSCSPRISPRSPDSRGKKEGIRSASAPRGRSCARSADDGSDHAEPRLGTDFITERSAGQVAAGSDQPAPVALGAHWGEVDAVRHSGRRRDSACRRRRR